MFWLRFFSGPLRGLEFPLCAIFIKTDPNSRGKVNRLSRCAPKRHFSELPEMALKSHFDEKRYVDPCRWGKVDFKGIAARLSFGFGVRGVVFS